MRYLIDTNICIYIMNKRPVDVIDRFKHFEPGDLGISAITLSELQYGVAKSKNTRRNRLRLEEFTAPFDILFYDEAAAIVYGNIRAELERRGLPIGPLDLLIAAQAISRDLVLVTNNEKEFRRIDNLEVENWSG